MVCASVTVATPTSTPTVTVVSSDFAYGSGCVNTSANCLFPATVIGEMIRIKTTLNPSSKASFTVNVEWYKDGTYQGSYSSGVIMSAGEHTICVDTKYNYAEGSYVNMLVWIDSIKAVS